MQSAHAIESGAAPNEEGAVAVPLPPSEPIAPKPKAPAKQPGPAAVETAGRTPVVPPLELAHKTPNFYPPELNGKAITIWATVGENGKAKDCVVINRGLSPDAVKFIIDFVLKEFEWNPAIADDGKPIESRSTTYLRF
jgi:hypothetical protein